MKRTLINILLSMLILFSNSGWAISFHYCKNTLSSVSLQYLTAVADKENDPCATMNTCCGDEDNTQTPHKKCCDNTSVTSSISGSTTLVKALELQLQPFVIASPTLPSLVVVQSSTQTVKNTVIAYLGRNQNPPPLYVLYCQRVYYS